MKSRRDFLKNSAALALCYSAGNIRCLPADAADDDKIPNQVRSNLLQLINEERAVAKVAPVVIDQLATEVATKHARDMATHKYASHWNRDGLKPYQRYSFAGGFHATQENISAADNTWSMQLKDLLQDTSYLHLRLYNETPPNDGHRKAILAPQQTHVGFGVAVDELRLRVVELFVAKHVDLDSPAQKGKPGETVYLTGKLMNLNHTLTVIEVFYEPLPKELKADELNQSRAYSLPTESVNLLPRLPPPYQYADRAPGVIEGDANGRFRAPITLFKSEPGIYTVVCWVKTSRSEKAFPATELCIRAE
ncbi:MAG TPA: CAP domain-containing protein [Pyrinomonadaceae bacterium]|nr:CAP domain-containing protein [Pyrinomonadaceae bacterium]